MLRVRTERPMPTCQAPSLTLPCDIDRASGGGPDRIVATTELGDWRCPREREPAPLPGAGCASGPVGQGAECAASEAPSSTLEWAGTGRLYGWRVYRDAAGGRAWILNAGGSRRLPYWREVDPALVPAAVRAQYEAIAAS